MPWGRGSHTPQKESVLQPVANSKSEPERYRLPPVFDDGVIIGKEENLFRMREYRRMWANLAQEPLEKDFKQEVNKWFKAADYVVKYMEGHPEYASNWRHPRAGKELAPFLDRCFKYAEL